MRLARSRGVDEGSAVGVGGGEPTERKKERERERERVGRNEEKRGEERYRNGARGQTPRP